MKNLYLVLITAILFVFVSCETKTTKNDDEVISDTDVIDVDEDTGDTGNTGNTGNTGDTGDTGNTAPDEEADDLTDEVLTESDEEVDDDEADSDEVDNEELDDDIIEEPETHEIIGKYSDSWGGTHIISNTVWDQGSMMGKFNIELFDSGNDYIIAQNDSANGYNPDKWSRFDYLFDSSKLYICQIVYDKNTMQEAIDSTTANRADLAAGCNGFGWTELTEISETGIDKADALILAWATGHTAYTPGSDVDESWKTPDKALGTAEGTSTDIVSLGRGGSIVLTFAKPVKNGDGADFAVFENSFSEKNLELGYVEVSSDGTNFVRFDTYYFGVETVGAFGEHEPALIWGFAGKFKQGIGTKFDLADLAGKTEVTGGTVNLDAITHIKIVDVIGDGSELDSLGNPVYDPYPTTGSAGFDLDAVGVMNVVED